MALAYDLYIVREGRDDAIPRNEVASALVRFL
jgi:hypothetical protein